MAKHMYAYVIDWLKDELEEPRELAEDIGEVYYKHREASLNDPRFVEKAVKIAIEAYEGGAR